ncbi:MAG: fibronectin type III domain-containing protein, partial [Armatimonadetes bacterium]|nr:fibronectin type III domain-containing protein [Armatimonadota bacterium]
MTPFVFSYRTLLKDTSGGRALLLALALAGALRPADGQTVPGGWVPLPGHRTAAAAWGRVIGRVVPSQPISLTLGLAPRDPQGLDDLLRRLYDPADPLYRHFLTPAQFAARFSPTPTQYAAVAAFARAQGLTVTGATSNRLLLHVEAPSAAVEAAFGVRLHQIQDAGGRLFHAPDAEPVVPAALAPLLTGVIGLDDSAVFHPHYQLLASGLPPLFQRPVPHPGRPSISTEASPEAADTLPFQIGSGPGGGLTPTDIRAAYNVNTLSLNGAGQTLAVFELDGYTPSDITGYENAYGLPAVPLATVPVDHNNVPFSPGGGAAEVTLDIELQIALAPGASKIMVYEGPNTDQGLLDTYNKIATDNQAKQISTSWGLDEQDMGTSFIQAERPIFQQMATQGQSLFAAAGDAGAYDNGSTLSVDDPASQPYVTGVGGTSLTTNGAGGAWQRETTWNNGSGSAGGGGISAVWAIPSWQQGVVSPASHGSTTMRNVPDVALDANPYTGYSIFLNGGWALYGGTSCASPLWAAYTALVNQQRQASGVGVLGYANPILYAVAQGPYGSLDFHDIADGSTNLYYPAVAGYDDATGWGTLNGANLLADLAPPPPSGLTASAQSTSQINLTWNAVPHAVGYAVLRGTAHGGPYTQVGTTAGTTSFNDSGLSAGTTYYYVVAAHTAAETSAYSNEASATTSTHVQPPAAPTGLTATAGNGQVGLSWQAVNGAASYNVYRSTTSSGEGVTPYKTGLAAAAFTDTAVSDGTAYYYVVTAVNAAGESAHSAEASATPFSVPAGLNLGFEAPALGSGPGAYQYAPAGASWAFTGGAGI